MEWLSEHSNALNAVGTLGLLAVWIVYAHVFYKNLRRQTRPRIIIDAVAGRKANPVVAITNLSSEPIYVECVIGVALADDQAYSRAVTETASISTSTHTELEVVSRTRQGPIATGQLITIGTVDEIVQTTLRDEEKPDGVRASLKGLEIRVVATMSSEDQVIGAWKRFAFQSGDGRCGVRPEQLGTTQMQSRRDKRRVRSWLDVD